MNQIRHYQLVWPLSCWWALSFWLAQYLPVQSLQWFGYDQNDECTVWLAPSTIPGAGIGMFAGKNFQTKEVLLEDSVIALTDLLLHNDGYPYGSFLWDEYTWSAGSLKLHGEGVAEVNAISFGFGSAANCMLALLNVDEGMPTYVNVLDRSNNPGAGASTHWHFRPAVATRDIMAGHELFVSYGSEWFTGRPQLGPIPLYEEFKKATKLLRNLNALPVSESVKGALYETFVQNTPFVESRLLKGALGGLDWQYLLREFNGNVTAKKLADTKRTDLRETGVCADHMKVSNSTLPHAGLGAFARRNLLANTTVGILPMVHILNRTQLDMYAVDAATGKLVSPKRLIGQQILLNYCYGHRESSMLLCPYGPIVNYVNHNQTLANVKLQWVESGSNHQPELLQKSIPQLREASSMTKLAMEFVALRDIEKGEEIFVDYGDEWESAWLAHLESWKPAEQADKYESASDFQRHIHRQIPLRTAFEEITQEFYPSNVDLQCDTTFASKDDWKGFYGNGTLKEYLIEQEGQWAPCEVLRYNTSTSGEILYTIHIFERQNGATVNSRLIKEVPTDIFHFLDRPYTTDAFLENAFRHDIRIPDDLFPDKWRNLLDLADG